MLSHRVALIASLILPCSCATRLVPKSERDPNTTFMAENPEWQDEQAKKFNAEYISRGLNLSKVQSGKANSNFNMWGAGFAIGSGSASQKGLLITQREFDFHHGQGLLPEGYPPEHLGYSTLNDKAFKDFQSLMSEPSFALSYAQFFFYAPSFLTETNRYVLGVQKLKPFEQSDSFKKYGYVFKDENTVGRMRSTMEKGYIVRTKRWGIEDFGKVCTAYVHLGGTREESTFEAASESYVTHVVPNIVGMNLESEEGCVFMEDVALAGRGLVVHKVTQFFPGFSFYGDRIRCMMVIPADPATPVDPAKGCGML